MSHPQNSDADSQLSLLDISGQTDIDSEAELDFLEDDFGFDEPSPQSRTVNPTQALLTLKLLRQAIQSKNPDDQVMQDFAEIVLPKLLKYSVGVTAKGGKFFAEYLDRVVSPQRIADGKDPIRRDNAADQSLNTHLLNGLFPANLIERRLQRLNTTAKRIINETERRILVAGFILHDFEKFNYALIPEISEKYRIVGRNYTQDIRKLSIDAHRELISSLVEQLELHRFIAPDQPEKWFQYRDDLLFLAYNAQRRNDTNLNLAEDGLNPILRDRTLGCLADLTCLADRLASIIKHPRDVETNSLNEIIHSLSDGQLRFTYHAITENRGVLTNVVNNALMDAHTVLNDEANEYFYPLLYLPTGVIYLTQRDAPSVEMDSVPDRVVASIKSLCAGQLRLRQTGFGRDGKGMKYADYYTLFFDDVGLMEVAADATLRILTPQKPSVASKRSDNLITFQQKQVLSANYDFSFQDDIRIDQLAEFGDLVNRKIWGDRVNNSPDTFKF